MPYLTLQLEPHCVDRAVGPSERRVGEYWGCLKGLPDFLVYLVGFQKTVSCASVKRRRCNLAKLLGMSKLRKA